MSYKAFISNIPRMAKFRVIRASVIIIKQWSEMLHMNCRKQERQSSVLSHLPGTEPLCLIKPNAGLKHLVSRGGWQELMTDIHALVYLRDQIRGASSQILSSTVDRY